MVAAAIQVYAKSYIFSCNSYLFVAMNESFPPYLGLIKRLLDVDKS